MGFFFSFFLSFLFFSFKSRGTGNYCPETEPKIEDSGLALKTNQNSLAQNTQQTPISTQ